MPLWDDEKESIWMFPGYNRPAELPEVVNSALKPKNDSDES
jgi:hypothetical protein